MLISIQTFRFGNGARGCIGRPFAWQEVMMVTAMVLQYFDLSMDGEYRNEESYVDMR